MFKHILCPIDGSITSIQALDVAARLANDQKARLTICTVTDPAKAASMAFGEPNMSAACYDALIEEGKALAADATARIKEIVDAHALSLDGQPVETIVGCAAAQRCDLIVMGSHGRSGIKRALLGSVAEGVLRQATVPVMVIRHRVAASIPARNADDIKAAATG